MSIAGAIMQDFVSLSGLIAFLALAFGYLCGSIPFGLVLTRLAGTDDIRTIGSKNIGATNVLRTGRKDLAIATLLLDMLKGTLAAWIASHWGVGAGIMAGFGAFLGHLFPVWLKFQGGKGVATFIGVILALWWPGVLIFAGVWGAMAYFTRYSSLSALVASVLVPLARVVLDLRSGPLSGFAIALLVMTVLLWWKHNENIRKLLLGIESKIGQKG